MRIVATVGPHTTLAAPVTGRGSQLGGHHMTLPIGNQSSLRYACVRRRLLAVVLMTCALLAPLQAAADSTGEHAPTSTSGAFTNGAGAFACDNTNVAEATGNLDQQIYSLYGLSVPPTATVTGIQVRVRATDGTKNNRKLQVALSWNGGTSWTANLNTRNFRRNAPLRDFIVGGAAVLWGHAWTAAELSNFQLRLTAKKANNSDTIKLDCIPVTVFYQVPGAPNLTVEKTDSPDPVQPLQNITYTIAYSNTGQSTATNVIISDTTPANTTFVSASPTATSAPSVGGTGTVTWNVGSVAPGGSGVVTLVVKVDSGVSNGTQIVNDTYSIDSDQNSPTPGNAVSTTVQGTIVLSLTKTDSPDPVPPGTTLTYTLTVTNNGNVASTGIMVNEAYDGNVTFTGQSSHYLDAPMTSCTTFDPDLDQWTIASLAAGRSCVIVITTTVNSPLADGVLIFNSVDLIDDASNTAEASAITTVHSPCGDGMVTGEECDEGAANGTSGSCCTATCTFRASGAVCRPEAGVCDVQETCSGSSGACPADGKSTAECRASGGVCDLAENCDGLNNDCPADAKSSAQCRASGGVCDLAENCDGLNNDCPADAKSTGLCRASGGVCDLAENCDGLNNDCPADAKSTGLCRASGGVCDLAENCDGSNNDCPADAKSTVQCRASAGVCDSAENCDGVNNACPADAKSTALCRASAGVCDLAESCDGSNDNCPTDAFKPASTSCRAGTAGEVCDAEEFCTGNSAACPPDAVKPNTTTCRASAGPCDPAESCDGSTKFCPADAKSTAQCRASGGVCDLAETCDGVNNDCPADAKSAAQCRPSAGVCDLAESCDGVNNGCPADAKSTAQCRASAGVCDLAESCDGVNNNCPANAKSTAPCRAAAGECDLSESCDGTNDNCPADAKKTSECRAAAGVCDVAESCDGVNNSCPTDAFKDAGTPCSESFCDPQECNMSGACVAAPDPCPNLGCDDNAGMCVALGCAAAPRTDCHTSVKSLLLLKDKSNDAKDKLIWKWIKGQSTDKTEFADPTTTANYALCIYQGDGEDLVEQLLVPPSNTKWTEFTKGYKYTDTGSADGVTKMKLKASTSAKSKALVKARGTALPMPTPVLEHLLTLPVKVQLVNQSNSKCFDALFSQAKKDTASQFKAKK